MHALLFMVPLGLPSARPMAQAYGSHLSIILYIIILLYSASILIKN